MQNKKNWNIFLIVWLSLQVFSLMVSNCTWEKGMYYPQKFFPFCGYPRFFYPSEKNPWDLLVYTYSYSEFFVYSIPAILGLYFLNRQSASFFESKPMQFTTVHSNSTNSQNNSDPRLVSIKTKTPGLVVSVIIGQGGMEVPKNIGTTPISVNRYTYNGFRIVIQGPKGNVDFYLKDQNHIV
jgi:hypothetical protein